MKTKTNGLRDYLKANRRASREAEIGNHDRPVSFSRVHKSKKVYDRKKLRADDKRHSMRRPTGRKPGTKRVHGTPTILPTLGKNRG